MNKIIIAIIVVAFIAGTITSSSVVFGTVSQCNQNPPPSSPVWFAICDLQNQINHIQLIPGPQGPPGTISAQLCPTNQFVKGFDSQGKIICSGVGTSVYVKSLSQAHYRVYTVNVPTNFDCNNVNAGGYTADSINQGIDIKATSTLNDGCIVTWARFDTTNFPSNAQIISVKMNYSVVLVNNPRAGTWTSMLTDPNTESAKDNYFSAFNGTVYVNNDNNFKTIGSNYQIDLGPQAVTDFKNNLAKHFFAVGMNYNPISDGSWHYTYFNTPPPTTGQLLIVSYR